MVVILPLLGKLGRMKCYCGTFIGGGVACILVAAITLTMDVKCERNTPKFVMIKTRTS